MNIIELRVSNFQRISAVRIRPDGHVVTITGATDQGKTSVLKSIWTLVEGRAAAPAVLIRAGEEQCSIYADFGDFKVTRTFTRAPDGEDVTMSLKILNADGTVVRGKQQAALDKLINGFSFDPLAFAKASPKVQFDTLKQFVSGVDFDKMADQRKMLFDKRTDTNRLAKQFRTLAEQVQLPPGPCPRAVDTAAKLTALEDANRRNAGIMPEKQRRDRMLYDITAKLRERGEKKNRISELRDQIMQLVSQCDALQAEADAMQAAFDALPPLPTEIDTAAIRAEIAAADQIKAVRDRHQQRRKHEDEAERLEGEASEITAQIEDLDRQKREAVASAKMPVEGITFGDGEILLNGIPFSQAGTAMKIKTSVAIGMSSKPELRVMTLDEGSELDHDDIATIEELAIANDFQVWMVRVDDQAEDGLIMVDGHLYEEGSSRSEGIHE